MPLVEAALEGARLRLRPILMTSFAFILGLRAAVDRARVRRGGAADPGHGRDHRHAGGDAARHLPHPAAVRPVRAAGATLARRAGARATAPAPAESAS